MSHRVGMEKLGLGKPSIHWKTANLFDYNITKTETQLPCSNISCVTTYAPKLLGYVNYRRFIWMSSIYYFNKKRECCFIWSRFEISKFFSSLQMLSVVNNCNVTKSEEKKTMFQVEIHLPLFVFVNTPHSVADLRGGVRDARPPLASKFFQFHAVFGRIWQNCVFTPPPPPLEGSRPPLGKSWIRHCHWHQRIKKLSKFDH